MSKRDESAFPLQLPLDGLGNPRNQSGSEMGLTKREMFAAMAMQGFIAGCYAGDNAGFTVAGNVFAAVEYADALIAALAEEGGDE